MIVTYHRVVEKWDETLDYSQPGMVVTAAGFERQLNFLMDHFDIVPLGTLLREDKMRQRARPPVPEEARHASPESAPRLEPQVLAVVAEEEDGDVLEGVVGE